MLRWALRMAWRDSRRHRGRLLLFMSTIVLGTAALVAIQSLAISLRLSVDEQSKTLLGADLVLEGSQTIPKGLQSIADSLQGTRAREAGFASMVVFTGKGTTRLAQARALEEGYPFYGEWETDPPGAQQKVWQGPYAVIDAVLMAQLGVRVGDTVKIGAVKLAVAGQINQVAGEAAVAAMAGPRVVFDYRYLPQTRLIQFGSRVNHRTFFKLDEKFDAEAWVKNHKTLLDENQYRATTVEGRRASIGRTFTNLFSYFNLVGFIALVLGGVGVASAVQVYVRQRIPTIAMLRCLGAPLRATGYIYLAQVFVTGLLGSLLGVAMGMAVQLLWPYVLQDFLPVQIRFQVSGQAIAYGLITGLGVTLLFSLLPLLAIRFVSPLEVLRNNTGANRPVTDPWRWAVLALIALSVGGFAWLQVGNVRNAIGYTVFLVLACSLLLGVAALLIRITRRYFPSSAAYVLRQGVANLFRPNNQTLMLVLSLGLGAFLLFTLYLVQDTLLMQADLRTARSQRANMLLFDVQNDQLQGTQAILKQRGFPVIEHAPVVTVRLYTVRGKTFAQLRADTTMRLPFWAGEYRVSYRDSLLSTETVVNGKFTPRAAADSIFISVGEEMQRLYKLKLKDEVVFDVQGLPIRTYVGSVRKINYLQARPSYLWLFPTGVLEQAPQFHLLYTRVTDSDASGALQRALIERYPNISVVDFGVVIKTVEDLLDRVALVIRFLAMFSLFTGLVVLVGAMLNSRLQRVRENTLLRTLGANRRQLLQILTVEYAALGILSACTGLLLAVAATWALTKFVFEIDFRPSALPLFMGIGLLALLTLTLGVLGNRQVVNTPPLQVLREEA